MLLQYLIFVQYKKWSINIYLINNLSTFHLFLSGSSQAVKNMTFLGHYFDLKKIFCEFINSSKENNYTISLQVIDVADLYLISFTLIIKLIFYDLKM